jgi:hypothetical protein
MVFNATFNNISVISFSFIGGGNRRTWKKPPTCHKSLTKFITYFKIELKRTKLTSHTDTKLMDMSDQYRLRYDNSPVMEKVMH